MQDGASDAPRLLGYISSTPVPNAALNVLFDLLSAYTLEKKTKRNYRNGLINQFDYPVKDVELKIVANDGDEAAFKVAGSFSRF